jgi:iron complex outermembrane receptor protein
LCLAPVGLSGAWAASDTPAPTTELELITVTDERSREGAQILLDAPVASGSRLELTVRETPASVEIIDRDTMRSRGLTTTQQALDSAVGVQAGQCFGLTCYSTRGFAGTLSLPFLYNGLRYPGLAMSPRGTFNYDRIEVLRGPASVLNGFGSIGGAVNFVTKAADGVPETELFTSFDSWNQRVVGVGVGGSATEQLAYRLDVSHAGGPRGSSGFVDRTSYEYYHASGELRLAATERFTATLAGEYIKDQGEWYFGTPTRNGRILSGTKDENFNVDDDRVAKDIRWLRLRLEQQLDAATSLSNETYSNNENRYWRNAEVVDIDPVLPVVTRSDFLAIQHDQELLGNVTQLKLNQPLFGLVNRLVIGYDISRNLHQRDNNSPFAGSDTVDLFNPVPGRFSSPSPFLPNRKTRLVQQALFIEDYLNLTDALKLSLAGRRDWIDLDSRNLRTDAAFDQQWSGNSYRAGLVYDLTPGIALYGQWSRALETPSQIVTLTEAQRNFDLTQGRQWEAGVKADLPRGWGEVTFAYFDIVRTDVLTRDPLDPTLTVQIGEQSSNGFELAVALRPHPQWAIDANVSLLDARFDDFNERFGAVSVSRAGNLPPDVAEKLGDLWVSFYPNADWRLGANAQYVGPRAANNANSITMDSYTILGLSASRALFGGEITLRGRNLTDKVYANRSYGTAGSQFLLGEPRSVEVSWHGSF